MNTTEHIRQKTIEDFGDQWDHFTKSTGVYGESSFLQDLFGPLLSTDELAGKDVVDIGSGTGRICEMLLRNNAAHVYAVEPSEKAFKVLRENLKSYPNVTLCNVRGDGIPSDISADMVVSLGVIHHIKNPSSTLKSAFDLLRDGGRCVIWVYGREGNTLYLALFRTLHVFTRRLSHKSLLRFCRLLKKALNGYLFLCKFLPVPMRSYFNNVIRKWDEEVKLLTIYDQLNPEYARYYRGPEIKSELEDAGFQNVRTYHRHGYSWTVVGEK